MKWVRRLLVVIVVLIACGCVSRKTDKAGRDWWEWQLWKDSEQEIRP